VSDSLYFALFLKEVCEGGVGGMCMLNIYDDENSGVGYILFL